MKDIYIMELFEEEELPNNRFIVRVPGGWILNQFYGTTITATFIPFSNEFMVKEKKETVKRDNPPKLWEVIPYFQEKSSTVEDGTKFFNYYESNGWKVGKNPIKNWKAAASGWIARNPIQGTQKIDFIV